MTNLTLLQAAIDQLNAQDGLPVDFKGQMVLYRLTVIDADFVKIEGFVPQSASGEEVSAAQDFKQEVLWVAPQNIALDDYVQGHDGFAKKLVRLNTPFREHRFDVFGILEDRPVFSLLLPIETAALAALA